MSEGSQDTFSVQGERAAASVGRAVSVQSRVSSILAVGLMSVLGLGMLTWYYAHAMTRQTRERQSAKASSEKRAQGDLPLPSLGRIDPPGIATPGASTPGASTPGASTPAPSSQVSAALGDGEDVASGSPSFSPTTLREIPLAQSPVNAAYVTPPAKSPADLLLERQLSGAAFLARPALGSPPAAAISSPSPANANSETGELTALLKPSTTSAVRAELLPAQRLLLPKGAFLDCTLETAIDSTLPGMTTCVLATDTFGVDGRVVLLERGTKLVGETRGQAQQGSARIFVLWNEARTPTGVIVPLASPGADELGRAGLPGTVDRHFWDRFGAAMLVSVIDGAVQSAVQSTRGGSGAVIVNPSSTQDVMTEVLKGTINIPPTVVKHQGDRIQVLVARDLDFRSVYELRSTADAR